MDLNIFKEGLDWFENLIDIVEKYEIDEAWFTDKITALKNSLTAFNTQLSNTFGWLYDELDGYDARVVSAIESSWSCSEVQAQAVIDKFKELALSLGLV